MQEVTQKICNYLKEQVERNEFANVGKDVAEKLLITKERLMSAVRELELSDDYSVRYYEITKEPKAIFCKVLVKKGTKMTAELAEKVREDYLKRHGATKA